MYRGKGEGGPYFERERRVVRALEFDVAEMAIMTFLVAKAFNKPYRLLPFVVMARFHLRGAAGRSPA